MDIYRGTFTSKRGGHSKCGCVLSLLLHGSLLAPIDFSPGIITPQKSNISKFQFYPEFEAGHSVVSRNTVRCYPR